MFQLCFNFKRIHDSVGKALRTANQGRVTVNSHALFSFSDPCLKPHNMTSVELFYNSIHWRVSKGLNYQPRSHFPIFGNPCPQSIRITTYQSAIFYGEQWATAAFSQQKHILLKNIITQLGALRDGIYLRHRIKIRISCINYIMAYYEFTFTLFDKARQTFFIFSSPFYPNLTRI